MADAIMRYQDLRQRWMALAGRYCDSPVLALELFEQIARRYSEPHRAYHTLEHIGRLFDDIDAFRIENPGIDFAIWFHDIIYRPGASSNEANSAEWARLSLRRFSLPDGLMNDIDYMIRCTVDHENPAADAGAQLFLDADMAILGSDDAEYHKYLRNVRREFRRVPDFLYRRGRARFAKGVLDRPRIYLSEPFYRRYETAARANLRRELGDC